MANDNKLELILTDYGARRIAELMEKPDETLAITKIKIGSGKNNEYYNVKEEYRIDGTTECPIVTGLLGDLGYEFYIYDKQLLEDGLTVSFHTVIPEDVGGFDIREVGLYETRGGDDHLFAISTQQPFIKPSPQYNYFISLNYYIFLKEQNLAEIYDRITLDVEYAAVTEPDLESLMKTFLFAQENLMTQIGKNTELLGYNRPTQLLEKVNENKTNYSYITLYKNFASVLDLVKSADNIFSYWVFDYSRRESLGRSITDLSNNKYYLSTNKLSSLYPHYFDGFQSMFKFGPDDYYELSSYIPVDLHDPDTGKDSPFTMVFTLEPNNYNTTRTIIAKSNYEPNQIQVFEVQELGDGTLQVKLFTDSSNYVVFSSANAIPTGPHSIVLTYDPDQVEMHAYVNSSYFVLTKDTTHGTYTGMNTSAGGTFYKYEYLPTIYVANSDNTVNPLVYDNDLGDQTIYCTEDGATLDSKGLWNVPENEVITYNGTTGAIDLDNPTEITLYAWVHENSTGTDPDIIYTKDTTIERNTELYNSDFHVVPDDADGFHIAGTEGNYRIDYGQVPAEYEDSRNIERYVYKCTCTNETKVIYTVTNNLTSAAYPLFTEEDGIFTNYTGTNWTIQSRTIGEEVTYALYYDNQEASLSSNPAVDSPIPPLTSYLIGETGQKKDPVNSKVGLISIIKEKLSDADARVLALNLCATMGRNPFLSGD